MRFYCVRGDLRDKESHVASAEISLASLVHVTGFPYDESQIKCRPTTPYPLSADYKLEHYSLFEMNASAVLIFASLVALAAQGAAYLPHHSHHQIMCSKLKPVRLLDVKAVLNLTIFSGIYF